MSLTSKWKEDRFRKAGDVPDDPPVIRTIQWSRADIQAVNELIRGGMSETEAINTVAKGHS